MASESLPQEMKALTLKGKTASVTSIPLPKLRPTHLLIKVHSVALNPTDWKHIASGSGGDPFSIVGCDYSGTVVSIGDQVTKSFKIGERVFGCAHGSNYNEPYDGVFAEYAVVKGDLAMRVPASVGMEDVSTIGLGSITVGQGLFQKDKGLGLNPPEAGKGNGEWVLIHGGGTATGTLGIQYAKLAGYNVITTCSPRNNNLVKSRGADEVFDYNDPECGNKIRKFTENKLKYAWDTVGLDESSKVCGEALSSKGEGCHYGTILRNKSPREDVKYTSTLMYTVFGEKFDKFGFAIPAIQNDFEFGKMWMGLTEKLVSEGKLKPHPAKVGKGNLEGILEGLDEMKQGKVRGEKMVYSV
jgi:NADPH:quinone reductase-like Zn-dependent oxidoreductase